MTPTHVSRLDHLGDFTTSPRVIPISLLAVVIGLVAAVVAAALLKLIGLCTNIFFFQRIDTALVSPAGHHLGPFVVLVPIAGALVIGLLARYGSERIRGHGIPEAIWSFTEGPGSTSVRLSPSSCCLPRRQPARVSGGDSSTTRPERVRRTLGSARSTRPQPPGSIRTIVAVSFARSSSRKQVTRSCLGATASLVALGAIPPS